MIEPGKIAEVIYQGTTYRLSIDREEYPYDVIEDANGVIRKTDGTEAPDTDRIEESYVGCSARAQIRENLDSPAIIASLTTENNGIVLGGKRLSLFISPGDTSAMSGWTSAICHVEVVRANGDVERQYEITFTLDREGTK